MITNKTNALSFRWRFYQSNWIRIESRRWRNRREEG